MESSSTNPAVKTDPIANALGTWFGLGLSPVAPGTVGSFGAIPVHLALRALAPGLHTGVVVAISLAGFWSAHRVAAERGEEDPQRVVIDEVAGVLIAMGLVRKRSLGAQAVAFALFRLLDITKPGPVGEAEKLKPAGVGIMMDDLVAGAAAGVLARILTR